MSRRAGGRRSVTGWHPSQRIGAGLTGWFEEGVLLNVGAASQWTNLVPGSARHFTQGTGSAQPPYIQNDSDGNGRAALNFTGAAEMINSGTVGDFFSANALTIIGAVKPNAAVGLDTPSTPWRANVIVGANLSSFVCFSISSSTRLFASIYDTVQQTAALSMTGATTKRVVSMQKTATQVQGRENNGPPAVQTAADIGALTSQLTLGRSVPGSSGDFANMKYYALLLFNVTLPPVELGQAKGYLLDKYGRT